MAPDVRRGGLAQVGELATAVKVGGSRICCVKSRSFASSVVNVRVRSDGPA
jgi:hypothetical protein